MVLAGCGSSRPAEQVPTGPPKVPSDALISAHEIKFCSDISAPPLTFYDATQTPTGAEIDLGSALAQELNLKPVWSNTSFAGIIPALQGRQCDAILSQLYIKPERERVVDFVPYMYASNTLMVKVGNDAGLTGLDSLCGRKVASQTGTTVSVFLQDATAKCGQSGRPPIDIRQFNKDSEALQQLSLGLVDAYGTTLETASYAMSRQPGVYHTAGEPFNRIRVGMATLKSNQALRNALASALGAVQKNGKYAQILERWNLSGDSIGAQ
ncbi:ABC transporter substrate-binding protein [Pseudonocardia acaciae]|uniref:ABC transporter substrate-binding protein n=1 Tax=Pseudonocardia acaciae TaxID=551276 RepID=UPI000A3F956B|nr:ABC transporter substrate-binding protein [Pseudonocardia acaciae]